ncbi:RNA polymerase sigma factor [Sulfitobacter noctilucae]|uniref:RNA polymerase sigma factor n=1 Tax=Sulfitobacter noctilucae TaxID=1342302 RepID=UPI000468A07E|nr:RNA polymerase sigma factor [Sulfitobacter noctilucae]
MQTDDNTLALAAAGGDAGAFATLIERQYDRLFRLCFRLTGSQAEAEDLCQDICAALPAKLGGFRAEASFTTWVYRICVNAAHDRRRRAATHARAAEGWGDWELNRRAADEQSEEALDWLTTAMRHLPADLRDTLALVLDDMTHAQTAEILGVSEGTISWRISQAKKNLASLHKEDTV